MTELAKHKVRSQEYQVILNDEKDASHYQSAISLLQESRIVKLLERIMNQVEDADSIYQFNSIDLDLGTIRKDNFENEVVYRLEEKLLAFFRSNILENGELRSGKRIALTEQKLAQFKHFLDYGYLNQDYNSAHSPTELLHELIQKNEKGIRQLLMSLGKKESARKRMILQFDEPPLESIVRLVSKEDSEHIIAYKRNVLHLQTKSPLLEVNYTSFRNAVWEIILAYLFVESQSFYNKKNFLYYLINKIAVKYNLQYKTLLKLISNAVQLEKNLGGITDFKKIISSLELEDQEKKPKAISPKQNEIKELEIFLESIHKFFIKGTFSKNSVPLSREEINQQFYILLKSKNPLLTKYLIEWFADNTMKLKLLKLLNTNSIKELTNVFNVPFVINALGLLEVLNKHSKKADFNWPLLYENRHELILTAYPGKSQSRNLNISHLLSYLSKQLLGNKQELILFLKLIQNELPSKTEKGVSRYLNSNEVQESLSKKQISKATNRKDKQWDKILTELIQYTDKHERETWEVWIDEQLPNWLKSTELEPSQFFRKVLKAFKNDLSRLVLTQFIEKEYSKILEVTSSTKHKKKSQLIFSKTSKIPINKLVLNQLFEEVLRISKQKTLVISWNKEVLLALKNSSIKYRISQADLLNGLIQFSNNTTTFKIQQNLIKLESSIEFAEVMAFNKKQNTRVAKNEIVQFVLSKGTYPWWLDNYTSKQFNKDFFVLWKSVRFQKQAIQLIKKHGKANNIAELLNVENLTLIWINSSKREEISSFILSKDSKTLSPFANLILLFETKLLPLNLVETNQINLFRNQLFDLFIKNNTADDSELLQLLKSWVSKIPALQNRVVLAQITETLIQSTPHSTTLQEQVRALFPIEIKKEATETINSLEDFFASYFRKNQLYKVALQNGDQQVSYLLTHDVGQIKRWLRDSRFRELLLKEAELKTTTTLLRHGLPPAQQAFFNSTLYILNQVKILRDQTFKNIKTQFLQLLLFKISAGEIEQWNYENWSNLLYLILVKSAGEKSTFEILLSLNEASLTTPNNSESYNTKILDCMNSISNKAVDPLKVKKPNPEIEANKAKAELEEKPYKKLGEKDPKELIDPMFIVNAGLILLSPFLGMLFERCGLTNASAWVNDEAQHKAAHLLQYAAVGNRENEGPGWIINKVLCGIPISFPIDKNLKLSEEDKKTVDSLLYTVTQQWSPLKGTSVEGLRTSFLQRDAKIEEEEEQYYMIVEQQSFDMLLDQIPWNITKIKLSWMHKLLEVQWR